MTGDKLRLAQETYRSAQYTVAAIAKASGVSRASALDSAPHWLRRADRALQRDSAEPRFAQSKFLHAMLIRITSPPSAAWLGIASGQFRMWRDKAPAVRREAANGIAADNL